MGLAPVTDYFFTDVELPPCFSVPVVFGKFNSAQLELGVIASPTLLSKRRHGSRGSTALPALCYDAQHNTRDARSNSDTASAMKTLWRTEVTVKEVALKSKLAFHNL